LLVSVLGISAALALAALYASFTAASPVAPVLAPPRHAGVSAPRSSVVSAAAGSSPELERLQARRVLYETVDALLEASDYARARKLLDEDQARYSDELAPPWRDLEQGYRLIADCRERPRDVKPRIVARAFVQVTEAGGLVPKLRAACGL
jgi:hypothetical protein